jgi:hypothetical protein
MRRGHAAYVQVKALPANIATVPGVQADSSAATCGFASERASDLRRRPFPIFQGLAALGGEKSLGSPSDRAESP